MAEAKNDGIDQGIIVGERRLIKTLLKKFSLEETSDIIEMSPSEIEEILKSE